MAKMLGKMHRVPGACPMGCCGYLNLKKRKDKRMAHGIFRARERRALDKQLAAW